MAVATTTVSGGDDGPRVRARGEPEEGEKLGERVREVQGVRGVAMEVQGDGGPARQGGGGRTAVRARRARARPPGKEEDDRGRAAGLGQQVGYQLGRPGKWPR